MLFSIVLFSLLTFTSISQTEHNQAIEFRFQPTLHKSYQQRVAHQLKRRQENGPGLIDERTSVYSLRYTRPVSSVIELSVVPTSFAWTRDGQSMNPGMFSRFLDQPIFYSLNVNGVARQVKFENTLPHDQSSRTTSTKPTGKSLSLTEKQTRKLKEDFLNSYHRRFLPLHGLKISLQDLVILEDHYPLGNQLNLAYCALLIPVKWTVCEFKNCFEFRVVLSNSTTIIKKHILNTKGTVYGNFDQNRLNDSKARSIQLSGDGKILMEPTTMFTPLYSLRTKLQWQTHSPNKAEPKFSKLELLDDYESQISALAK